MNKLIIAIFLIICFSIPAHAEYRFAEGWTWKDTALEATFITLAVIDWGQTRWMSERNYKWDGQQHYEGNPFLGSQPSTRKVDFLVPAGIVLHGLFSMALPNKYHIKAGDEEYDIYPRRVWQYFWIGIEGVTVITTASLGARMEF